MKRCMKRAPVEKITVKEIVEECGTTRQTFYRNFRDKYDLINWYFDKILLESFEHMGEGKTVREGLVNKFHYIEDEKLFSRRHLRMMNRTASGITTFIRSSSSIQSGNFFRARWQSGI